MSPSDDERDVPWRDAPGSQPPGRDVLKRDPFADDHDDIIGILEERDHDPDMDLDLHPHQVGVKGLPDGGIGDLGPEPAGEALAPVVPAVEAAGDVGRSRPQPVGAEASRPRWQGPRGGSWLNRLVQAAVDAVTPDDEAPGPRRFDSVLLDLRALPRRDRAVAVTWMPRGGTVQRLMLKRGLHPLPATARPGDHLVIRPGGRHDAPGDDRVDVTLPSREQPTCVITLLPRGRARERSGYEADVRQAPADRTTSDAAAGKGGRAARR